MLFENLKSHFSTFEQCAKLKRFGIAQKSDFYVYKSKTSGQLAILSFDDLTKLIGTTEIQKRMEGEGKIMGIMSMTEAKEIGTKALRELITDPQCDFIFSAFDLTQLGIMLPEKELSPSQLPGWFIDKHTKRLTGDAAFKKFLNAEFMCDYLIAHIEKGVTSPTDVNYRIAENMTA